MSWSTEQVSEADQVDTASGQQNAAAAGRRKAMQRWTEAEHQRLFEIVWCSMPNLCWRTIATQLGTGRTGKQCRERWMTAKPVNKKGFWTLSEDMIIARMHTCHGPSWSRVATALQGRCDNDVKNHWNAQSRCRTLDSRVNCLLAIYVRLLRDGCEPTLATYEEAVRQFQTPRGWDLTPYMHAEPLVLPPQYNMIMNNTTVLCDGPNQDDEMLPRQSTEGLDDTLLNGSLAMGKSEEAYLMSQIQAAIDGGGSGGDALGLNTQGDAHLAQEALSPCAGGTLQHQHQYVQDHVVDGSYAQMIITGGGGGRAHGHTVAVQHEYTGPAGCGVMPEGGQLTKVSSYTEKDYSTFLNLLEEPCAMQAQPRSVAGAQYGLAPPPQHQQQQGGAAAEYGTYASYMAQEPVYETQVGHSVLGKRTYERLDAVPVVYGQTCQPQQLQHAARIPRVSAPSDFHFMGQDNAVRGAGHGEVHDASRMHYTTATPFSSPFVYTTATHILQTNPGTQSMMAGDFDGRRVYDAHRMMPGQNADSMTVTTHTAANMQPHNIGAYTQVVPAHGSMQPCSNTYSQVMQQPWVQEGYANAAAHTPSSVVYTTMAAPPAQTEAGNRPQHNSDAARPVLNDHGTVFGEQHSSFEADFSCKPIETQLHNGTHRASGHNVSSSISHTTSFCSQQHYAPITPGSNSSVNYLNKRLRLDGQAYVYTHDQGSPMSSSGSVLPRGDGSHNHNHNHVSNTYLMAPGGRCIAGHASVHNMWLDQGELQDLESELFESQQQQQQQQQAVRYRVPAQGPNTVRDDVGAGGVWDYVDNGVTPGQVYVDRQGIMICNNLQEQQQQEGSRHNVTSQQAVGVATLHEHHLQQQLHRQEFQQPHQHTAFQAVPHNTSCMYVNAQHGRY